jgi:hemoglobin
MHPPTNSASNQGPAEVQTASAYERVGGGPAVRAVVDAHYQRVLADNQLVRYFDGLDSGQLARVKRHQVDLISHVLGGPAQYPVETLGAIHAKFNIQPHHYRRTINLLLGTLWEFRVEEDIILGIGELLHSLESVIAPGSQPEAQAA